MSGYHGMGEISPLHSVTTSVYGPPQPSYGMPTPNYSSAPGAPYPAAGSYGQLGFPRAAPSFDHGTCAHMPYPQMPYSQGPYTTAPFPQMPYTPAPYTQGPYTQGPYTQEAYTQGIYTQGPYTQRPYPQGSVQQVIIQPGFPGDPTAPVATPGYHSERTLSRSENERLQTPGAFGDKDVRQAFIRKIFIVLTVQLLVIVSSVATFTFVDEAKLLVQQRPWLMYVSCAVALMSVVMLSCCGDAHRKQPWNLIALLFLTLSLSCMMATIASFYNTDLVLIAVGMTAVVCFSVVLFTLQSKYDFISCRGMLYVGFIVLLLFSALCVIYLDKILDRILEMAYTSLGTFLFTCFLAVDTQLMLGNETLDLDPDDYIFAAVSLYTNVISIFIYILTCCGRCRE